jgi:hypothetical protein
VSIVCKALVTTPNSRAMSEKVVGVGDRMSVCGGMWRGCVVPGAKLRLCRILLGKPFPGHLVAGFARS